MLPFSLPERYKATSTEYKGGQGTVSVCEDTYLERKVAIKAIDDSSSNALKKELKTLSQIQSRHVAELYDVIKSVDGSLLGLVQEFVSGETLEGCAAQIPHDKILRTLWQIASGICDIHQHGKIHRDLSPTNIRVDSEGVVKILDFGLALDVSLAETVQRRGTHHYAAPELFGIVPVQLTTAADVYALGVLAWFIVSKGSLPMFLCWSSGVKGVAAKSIATGYPSLTPELVTLLDSALNHDPKLRPTAVEIRDALQRQILFGRHKVNVTYRGTSKVLDTPNDTVKLSAGSDSAELKYDGYVFFVASIQGNVYVNNDTLSLGQILPASCVITLGGPTLGFARMFIPIDMANPGVEA